MPMPRSPHAVNAYRILARRRETLHPRVFLASQSVPGATAQHSPLGERPKNGASFDDAQHPRAASRSRAPPSRTARSIRFDSMCPCLIRDWLEAATEHPEKLSLSLFSFLQAVHVQLGCLFLVPPSPICAARSSSQPGASNGQSCNARSRQPTCLPRSPLHTDESHAAVDDSLGRALGGRPIRQRTDSAHGDLRAGFDPARMRLTTRWNKPTARPTRDGVSGARDHHRPGQGWGWGWGWGGPRASLPQSPHAVNA